MDLRLPAAIGDSSATKKPGRRDGRRPGFREPRPPCPGSIVEVVFQAEHVAVPVVARERTAVTGVDAVAVVEGAAAARLVVVADADPDAELAVDDRVAGGRDRAVD